MTLWYADREGLVVSRPFDILRDSHYFVLVIAAHHYGTMHNFGFSPLLSLPSDTPHLLNYDGAIITLPKAIDASLPPLGSPEDVVDAFDKSAGQELPQLQFTTRLDEGRNIHTAYGTVGRGTTVIPVVATGHAAELFGDERLVVKMAFPLTSRSAEDRFIRVIHRKLDANNEGRQFLKHIVDLKCSFGCSLDDKPFQHPRAAIGCRDPALSRCFRVLVMAEYFPLERIKSPRELQQIFRDVVTGELPFITPCIDSEVHLSRSPLGLEDVSHSSPRCQLQQHYVLPRRRWCR